MKKLIILIFALSAINLFGNSNYETENFHYEGSFSSRSVDILYTDLSTEDLEIFFHNENDIKIKIYGYTSYSDIEDFLDLGVDSNSFYVDKKMTASIFNKHKIKVDIYIPKDKFNVFDLSSSTGDIKCDSFIELQEFKVSSSTGDVYLEEIKASKVSIVSSTGEKEIGEIECDDLFIKSSTGDNKLGVIKCKRGQISGSTAELYIGESIGDINIKSSTGDIEISRHERGDLVIDASTAEIKIGLDSGIGYTVDLNTSTGDIRTNLALEIKGPFDEDKLKGKINGGGYKINIDTSTGDIVLH